MMNPTAGRCHPCRSLTGLPLLPAIGLALLPKCPLCWAAYVSAAVGVSVTPATEGWALALLVGALGTSLILLAVRRRHAAAGGEPLVIALLGSAALVAGRFGRRSSLLVYAGLGMLILTVIWSIKLSWRGTRRPDAAACRLDVPDKES